MENLNTRKQEFVGIIRKCPNCGAELPSMVAKCPQCGYEIVGATANLSLKDFFIIYQKEQDDMRKLDMIKNYPIPNTKEDLIEFALLAAQQITAFVEAESSSNNTISHEQSVAGAFKTVFYGTDKKVSQNDFKAAWIAKLELIKAKANIIFANDPITLAQINNIAAGADKTQKKSNSKKKRTILVAVSFLIVLFVVYMLFMTLLPTLFSGGESKEIKRLETLQQDILMDIQNNDYDSAELKLTELQWNYAPKASSSQTQIQTWNQKRELLQEQIDSKRKE